MSNYFEKKMELKAHMKDMDMLADLVKFMYEADVLGGEKEMEEKKKFSYISMYLASKYKTQKIDSIYDQVEEKVTTLRDQIAAIEESFQN